MFEHFSFFSNACQHLFLLIVNVDQVSFNLVDLPFKIAAEKGEKLLWTVTEKNQNTLPNITEKFFTFRFFVSSFFHLLEFHVLKRLSFKILNYFLSDFLLCENVRWINTFFSCSNFSRVVRISSSSCKVSSLASSSPIFWPAASFFVWKSFCKSS